MGAIILFAVYTHTFLDMLTFEMLLRGQNFWKISFIILLYLGTHVLYHGRSVDAHLYGIQSWFLVIAGVIGFYAPFVFDASFATALEHKMVCTTHIAIAHFSCSFLST